MLGGICRCENHRVPVIITWIRYYMYLIIALHLSDALPSYPISLRAGFQQLVSDSRLTTTMCVSGARRPLSYSSMKDTLSHQRGQYLLTQYRNATNKISAASLPTCIEQARTRLNSRILEDLRQRSCNLLKRLLAASSSFVVLLHRLRRPQAPLP